MIFSKFKFAKIKRAPKYFTVQFLKKISPVFNDELYLKIIFRIRLGYKLDLHQPQTYNEKLQWLKLNYRKPIMTQLVDKYDAKYYIKQKVGEEYVVKNYGIWNSFEDIDFKSLPNKFVLKTTHDQGGVVICKDKSDFDFYSAKKKINKHLRIKHYYLSREWPYKDVKPRILAEKYLDLATTVKFKDYKFYCFHGEPKLMYISQHNNKGELIFDFYDMDFKLLNIKRPYINNSSSSNDVPVNFELMKNLSRTLSCGFPHIRIDFYEIKNKVYVGEMTFYQGGGLMPFIPQEWDYILGGWLSLDTDVNYASYD